MKFIWNHNRRFNSYSEYFKKTFGERVQKVSIDAGFTCPNRDGKLARGGCSYCNNDAFNPSYCSPDKSVTQQLSEGIEFHKKRYRRANKYLAYFQTYSNTYAPIDHLKSIYKEALGFPGVIGLVIGTRPDCVDDEKLNWFAELAKQHYIIIEYGAESIYNKTLSLINRQHSWEQTAQAIEETSRRGINTGTHFIFGLPGESRAQMLDSVYVINQLPLTTIKFHQLQIVKGTRMALDYAKNPENYELFTMEEYINFIIRFIENLDPRFIIERFTGEVPPRFHAGPNWGVIRNDQVNHLIERKLENMDTWQGRLFKL
ncbi:MAG TPA: TIGR01212 family radical SAM protein [Bacteroidales bacterium]|nr:TIGR01212 family radical SAM protein [Bacteroidales bacterium]HRX97999.1 TIGR01212 family radical SAM protein [Bacteroidales bacterium]